MKTTKTKKSQEMIQKVERVGTLCRAATRAHLTIFEFGELRRLCEEMVGRFVVLNFHDHDREEIVAEFLLKLHTKRFAENLLLALDPGLYVEETLRNLANDEGRRQDRESRARRHYRRRMLTQPAGKWLGQRDAPTTDPHRNEDICRVRMALRTLPREDRQVVVWHHIEERSIEEIANRLGITKGAAAKRVCRARQQLFTVLKKPQFEAATRE
jgi:RNA polymerase sigma factor (sigma-70 family)